MKPSSPPSRSESQENAKHFANTVFVVGSGVIMFAASLVQPYTQAWLGGAAGEHFPFIAGTLLIAWLAVKRPQFALYSLQWQCRKHGHLLEGDSRVCGRCLENLAGDTPDRRSAD